MDPRTPTRTALRAATTPRAIVVGLVAVGVGVVALLLVRGHGDAQADGPWLVEQARPVASADLDPTLPLGEALQAIDHGAPPRSDDTDDPDADVLDEDVVDDDAPLFALPTSGPLPPGIARPGAEVDVSALGHTPPPIADRAPTDAAEAAGPDPATDDEAGPSRRHGVPLVPGAEGPADEPLPDRPPTVRDLGGTTDDDRARDLREVTDDEVTVLGELDEDDPRRDLRELTEEEAADVLRDRESDLLPFLPGLDRPAGLLGALDLDVEPDFLDACAAELDGVPIDCGDGTGATVVGLHPELQLLSIAVDHGPRCGDHLEVSAGELPIRMTFDDVPTRIEVGAVIDGLEHRRGPRIDDERAARHRATDARLFDQCVAFPAPTTPGVVVPVGGRAADPRTGAWHAFQTRIVAPERPRDARPPTTLGHPSDRVVGVTAWTRAGVDVVATVVTRDPAQPALTSQCTGLEAGDLAVDPGRVVELRSSGSAVIEPLRRAGVEHDRIVSFQAELQPAAGDRFELCLRWEEAVGSTRRVVDREAYYLDPPERPRVEITLAAGTAWDEGLLEDLMPVSTMLWFQPDGGGPSCELFRRAGELTVGLPHRICAFEAIDDLRGGVLSLAEYPSDLPARTRNLRIALPNDPSHPRFGDRCDRCADVYDLPLRSADHLRRVIGNVRVAVVTTGQQGDAGWLSFPLVPTSDDPDLPVLDAGRTRVITEMHDQDLHVLGVEVVADRPVTATLVARPAHQTRADATVPPGCPATRTPHVARTEVAQRAPVVWIDDACARTRYRLALELRDEDGATAVYGDALTWLLHQDGADPSEVLLGGSFVPGHWDPRVVTPGRRWTVNYEVRIDQVHVDSTFTPGVYAGPPRGPSRQVLSPRRTYEADRSMIDLVQADIGGIHLSRGSHSGDRQCVDRGRRLRSGDRFGFGDSSTGFKDGFGPDRVVEVGDTIAISALTRMESMRAGALNLLDGMSRCRGSVRFVRTYGLPRAADGGPPTLTADDIEAAGQVSIVQVSGYDRELAWDPFQTVITMTVERR